MTAFLLIGSIVSISLTIILGMLFKKRYANRILLALAVLISHSLLLNLLYISGYIEQIPQLIGSDNANPFLIPPLIYFYVKSLVKPKFKIGGKALVHFTPFAIYLVYLSLFFLLEDSDYKLHFLEQLQKVGMPPNLLVASFAKILQGGAYFYFTFALLRFHRQNIKDIFSTTEKIDLQWLVVLTICFSFIYGIRLVGISLPLLISGLNLGFIEASMELLNVGFLLFFLVKGIQQPQVFNSKVLNLKEVETPTGKKAKYSDSPLNTAESQRINNMLLKLMEEEKPYLNYTLTIGDLAQQLEVHTKSLSQVINEQHGLNFFNFVNTYRVEAVKQKLRAKEYGHYSIIAIAFECGFNSKSTFNSMFKRFTGTTPSNYRSSTS